MSFKTEMIQGRKYYRCDTILECVAAAYDARASLKEAEAKNPVIAEKLGFDGPDWYHFFPGYYYENGTVTALYKMTSVPLAHERRRRENDVKATRDRLVEYVVAQTKAVKALADQLDERQRELQDLDNLIAKIS